MTTSDTPQRQVLVTDFDGTITRRDFFWLVVEAFAPAHLEEHWQKYREKRITHFEALAGIFDKLEVSEGDDVVSEDDPLTLGPEERGKVALRLKQDRERAGRWQNGAGGTFKCSRGERRRSEVCGATLESIHALNVAFLATLLSGLHSH